MVVFTGYETTVLASQDPVAITHDDGTGLVVKTTSMEPANVIVPRGQFVARSNVIGMFAKDDCIGAGIELAVFSVALFHHGVVFRSRQGESLMTPAEVQFGAGVALALVNFLCHGNRDDEGNGDEKLVDELHGDAV